MNPKAAVIYYSLNPGGGAEKVAAVLSGVLKNRLGYNTTLYLAEKPLKAIVDQYQSDLRNVRIFASMSKAPFSGTTASMLCHESVVNLRCKNDTIINASGIYSPLSFFCDMVYVHFPAFYVDLVNSQSFVHRTYGLTLGAFGALLKKVLKQNDFTPQVIAANSHYTLSLLKQFLNLAGQKARVLYPPVNVRRIMEKTSFNADREDVVVTISRISPEKNLLIIPEIAKSLRDIKFVLVGRKRNEKYFETLIRKIKTSKLSNVEVLTNVTEETKMKILQNGKVYLHTMPYEQFGISIVEGMAAGLIPITHNSGGPKEFVPSNQRYEKPQDMIEKVRASMVLWTQERALEIAASALKFDIEKFESKAEELLASLR